MNAQTIMLGAGLLALVAVPLVYYGASPVKQATRSSLRVNSMSLTVSSPSVHIACKAVSPSASDDWCTANCNNNPPNCPSTLCKCEATCSQSQILSGCSNCADYATCISCNDTYVLDVNVCAPKQCDIVGCESCEAGSKTCKKCAPNYYGDDCKPWYNVPGPKPFKFYVYRAKNSENYTFGNCDSASASGVLGYLHHEVVGNIDATNHPVRKNGIDRIVRTLVYVHNPPAVYADHKSNFGPWDAFDSASCSPSDPTDKPGCPKRWETYGFAVGCQKNPFCPTCVGTMAEEAYFDFPGKCPTKNFTEKTAECKVELPGGECVRPDGRKECTWNATDAGFIDLGDLEGISESPWKTWANFSASKGCEYDKVPGLCSQRGMIGSGLPFWNYIDFPAAQINRTKELLRQFKVKYPDTEDLPEPDCDW